MNLMEHFESTGNYRGSEGGSMGTRAFLSPGPSDWIDSVQSGPDTGIRGFVRWFKPYLIFLSDCFEGV